ncbi:hypothetical protein L198_02982 [Cryptococcus wingfieldii CBS 7118]|uniref:Uncharacterized protein n=1 Tax=Cryptococcus wingfieldii CBS 7118 TaxID=1295528 RepID=A0A1E3JID5_9TREE|nr:hypothetical protein L198_02982 [Cryptococcus wingfieldii CBS 7118]ODO00659.1 hypothetical protein L198_02982 [Cryptococcus wingfieldii CBS 7118]
MPPKATETAPDARLSLPEWLKVFTSRGVDMRGAMALAAKLYKSHGSTALISQIKPPQTSGVTDDKEKTKVINNAIKALAAGETINKKRGRDSDLLQPLKNDGEDEEAPIGLGFAVNTDIEQLRGVKITTNRAPVKTAWAYTIALRLGFSHPESLSLAQAYVHINSLKHALKLGGILGEQEAKEARRELEELPGGADMSRLGREKRQKTARGSGGRDVPFVGVGDSAQPWVDILGAKPIIERSDGTCRAIQKGVPVKPGQAYSYISKAFKEKSPQAMGALKLVADSYEVEELNRLGNDMYMDFKPDVVEWGQRGTFDLDSVLEHVKGAEIKRLDEGGDVNSVVGDEDDGGPDLQGSVEVEPSGKQSMTLEEYEAMLDEEALEGLPDL